MSGTFVAAGVQMASGPNVGANLLEADRLVTSAVAAGARIVVLPENFAYMGQDPADVLEIAEPDGGGPIQEFLAKLARRHKVWLIGGTVPIRGDAPDKVRSACLVHNPDGERMARYDKMHLFDVAVVDSEEKYCESNTIEPGNEIVVVDMPCGRLGIAICYDLRFPELFRQMARRGVEVIAVPSAFTAITGQAHWEVLVRARAIENLCYVVAADQGGYHLGGRETHGNSMIVDPWGTMLDHLPGGSGVVTAELDRGRIDSIRRNFPALDHRQLGCE